MKIKLFILGLVLAVSFPASAALIYNSGSISEGIPDNNTLGTGNAFNYTASGLGTAITGVTLTFILQGGYSGDLSGYLRLGNDIGSPAYDLTTLIRGQTLISGSPTSYAIDFTTSGFQSKFDGKDPNTTWTLFFADQGFGATTTVQGWSLDVTAVPEPVNVALGAFVVMLLAVAGLKRARRTTAPD